MDETDFQLLVDAARAISGFDGDVTLERWSTMPQDRQLDTQSAATQNA